MVVQTALGPVVVRAGRRSGPTATILLHGAAGSWTTWTPLITTSDRAGSPLTDLLIPDLPGWGETPAPTRAADAGGPGIAQVSDAIVEIAVALGYRRWRIVGHSLGGFLALDIAVRAPHQTESVVLVSPTGPSVVDAVRRPIRGGRRLPWFAGMLLAMRILGLLGSVALVRAIRAAGMLRLVAGPLFADRARMDASVIDALPDELRPDAFVNAARAAAAYDLDAFASILSPVRSIRGRADVFASTRDSEFFAATIPDFREIRVTDAGHFAAIETPRAVLQLMGEV